MLSLYLEFYIINYFLFVICILCSIYNIILNKILKSFTLFYFLKFSGYQSFRLLHNRWLIILTMRLCFLYHTHPFKKMFSSIYLWYIKFTHYVEFIYIFASTFTRGSVLASARALMYLWFSTRLTITSSLVIFTSQQFFMSNRHSSLFRIIKTHIFCRFSLAGKDGACHQLFMKTQPS